MKTHQKAMPMFRKCWGSVHSDGLFHLLGMQVVNGSARDEVIYT